MQKVGPQVACVAAHQSINVVYTNANNNQVVSCIMAATRVRPASLHVEQISI
jgi:hypothetical protein